MRHVTGLLVCLAIGALICPSPGIGNMAPIRRPEARGGAVSPKSPHATIRMDTEQVIMRPKRSSYAVEAIFHFFNTGETTTEWVGFPKLKDYDLVMKKGSRFPTRSEFIRFDTWVNGKKIKVEEERESEIEPSIVDRMLAVYYSVQLRLGLLSPRLPPVKEQWMVHHVTFPGHAKTTICTSYEAHYSSWGAEYIVGTGRLWKDTIGKGVFVIDCSYVGGVNNVDVHFAVAPGPRAIGDSLVIFEIKKFEPEPDASLNVRVH